MYVSLYVYKHTHTYTERKTISCSVIFILLHLLFTLTFLLRTQVFGEQSGRDPERRFFARTLRAHITVSTDAL